MRKKIWIILSMVFIVIVIVSVIRVGFSSKMTILEIDESIQGIPLTVETMDLVLTGIDEKEYLTKDQIISRGKKFARFFVHDEACGSNCRKYHEDRYELNSDFNRLDKKLDIIGTTVGIPYNISLHNKKDQKYNLYYEMTIPLLGQKEHLALLQENINKADKRLGVEIKPSIMLVASIQGKVTKEKRRIYTNQILDKLNAYSKEDYQVKISEEEEIYYGYINYLKAYEKDEEGNKFNVIVKFAFNPMTQETQLILELSGKIELIN